MSKSDRLNLIRARAAVVSKVKKLADMIRADLSVFDTRARDGWLVLAPAQTPGK